MAKTKLLTTTALIAALCVVGSFIKIPVPPGTPALDAAPAFLSIAFLPAPFAAAAGIIGHLATALTSGFPLTLPLHLLIAAEMGIVVLGAALLYRAGMKKIAWLWIIIANGILSPLPFYFILSKAIYSAIAPGILMATLINVGVAVLAMPMLQKVFQRRGANIL
ncbi:ECF transporter S component [Kurthia sibirica]|uniref:ECF transporter S component n=1 Tax=Kurthia sibirica TaxID=202750 RepID=A0A2U3AKT6_9BACL|nr:ECF transporter S component [Kurthia sibirica]PWI25145.1 ECF transporter S component [Kurthia sibirica]GEK33230.1 hypothetical protein KSI01_07630 [Kurthia sibirica]